MPEIETQFCLSGHGAASVIQRALELLVTIEDEQETHGTVETEIVEEAERLRAVIDEHVEWRHIVVVEEQD